MPAGAGVVGGLALPGRRDEQLVGGVGRDLELGADEPRHGARLTQDAEPLEQFNDVVATTASSPQHKHASHHGGRL